VVGYHPGKQNSVADALSQRLDHWESAGQPINFKPFSEERMILMEELEVAALGVGLEQGEWDEAMEWAFCNLISTDGTLIEEIKRVTRDMDPKGENGKIWVPNMEDLRQKVVELYHDTPIMGHLGIGGTYELVTRGYQWEGIHEYITNYIHGCTICIRAKKRNYKLHGVLKPLPIPEGPWQWTESDHIVKLLKSKGKDAIYVVVDRFTKMAHFILTTEKAGEDNLVNLHMKHVWKLHGIPLIHSTDWHGTFTSKDTRKMFKALGIEQQFSTAYHPQTQGQVENLNSWLETFLRMFCTHQKDNWADLLHMAEFAWNNHHHSSIDMTPFFANYGMHPTITNVPSAGQQDTPTRIKRLIEIREEIKGQIGKAQEEQKHQYNKRRDQEPKFKVGDKVYLVTNHMVMDEGSKKLSDLRTGLFPVTEITGEGTYRLKLPPHMKVHLVFNVTLLTKAEEDLILGRAPMEPAPIIIKGHQEYKVESIINSNFLGKHLQYKVTYTRYGKEHNEWQFRDDLLEDLGQETLYDLEKMFYHHNPKAKRHLDQNKV